MADETGERLWSCEVWLMVGSIALGCLSAALMIENDLPLVIAICVLMASYVSGLTSAWHLLARGLRKMSDG